MKRCASESCNSEFIPREAKQRFCCRDCSNAWFANERKEAVAALRKQRQPDEATTYHAIEMHNAELSGGFVTGSSGNPPPFPAARYSPDPGGPDPLGFCIDDVEAME